MNKTNPHKLSHITIQEKPLPQSTRKLDNESKFFPTKTSTTVNDMCQQARSFFQATTGVSSEIIKAQNNKGDLFKNQKLNLETAKDLGMVESKHMQNIKSPKTCADKIAKGASYGGGFAPRNLAARFASTLISDNPYQGNNQYEQSILDMHYTNIYKNPQY